MLNDYAPRRVVYYSDGTKVNVLNNGKIVMGTKGLLGRQVSAQFDGSDAVLVEIRSIFEEIERRGEGTKSEPHENQPDTR